MTAEVVIPKKRAASASEQPISRTATWQNSRLAGFSSDRLMRFLAALGQDVEIVVRAGSRGRERGQIRVVKAA